MHETAIIAAIVLPLWWGCTFSFGLAFGLPTIGAIIISLFTARVLAPVLFT